MTDNKRPAEALRIADALIPGQVSVILRHAAADELRRQHAEIARLQAALADAQAEAPVTLPAFDGIGSKP